ncbi:MAG: transposase [Bdellovibrionota bacterium]
MARKKIIKSDVHAYHVWARANNKDSFPLPIADCWNIFNHYLNEITIRYDIKIHSFVLMNNHFHALISTPNSNLDKAMGYFMTQTSKGIGLASERINHVYGGPYGWTIADRTDVYAILYKYLYRNPVKAGITKNVLDYKWSTLTNVNFKYRLEKKVSHEQHIPETSKELIAWLNQPSPAELEEKIGKSLKKNGNFKFPKDSKDFLINLDPYLTQTFGKGAAHL